MPDLTMEQDEELTRLLGDLSPLVERMGEWDRKFTADQIERHRKFGSKIFMSAKQWEQVRRIHNEYVGTEDPTERDDEPPQDEDARRRQVKDAVGDDEIPF